MSKVVSIVKEKICPIIEGLGYEVVEVEYLKKNNGNNLTFYIQKQGGISLDDCELVSKAVDGPLDEINPTGDEPYNLNVSSPGLDRPIKTDRDYARNIGQVIELKLYSQLDKKKNYHGTLKEFTATEVVLLIGGDEKRFPREAVSLARPYIDFK